MSQRSIPPRLPESSQRRGVTATGWIGIGVMIASLFFLAIAAIEAVHRHAPEAAANSEIAVVFLIVGGLLLRRARLSAERAVRLASSGTATAGVVTGMAKTWYQGWGEDGTTRYALRFSYHDQDGRAHRGTAICPQTDAFQWRIGDRGLVRYDLQHPGRSVWIGPGLQDNAAREARLQPASESRARSPAAEKVAQPSWRRLAARSPYLRSAVLPVVLFGYVGVLALVFWNRPHGSVVAKILVLLFASMLLLRGTTRIAKGVRQVRYWSTLLREGAPADATVTAVGEQARFAGLTTPVMSTFWTIEYRYPDDAGLSRHGTSSATRSEALELRPGDTIAIQYDRDPPTDARPEEASILIGKLANRPLPPNVAE